jgi:hypothetical protein
MTPKYPQGTRLTRAQILVTALVLVTVLLATLTLVGGAR